MIRPPRACSYPGCGTPTDDPSGRCRNHPRLWRPKLKATQRAYDVRPERRADHRFYVSKTWRQLRAQILRASPLCVECQRLGRVTPATDVDHILPRRARPELQLDPDNLRALCHP